MKKYLLHFIACILIFVFTITPFTTAENVYEDVGLETSIVLLKIMSSKGLEQEDPFFEILNFPDENYLLIPINLISTYLDININYNREDSILTVVNPVNKREVRIDFKNYNYLQHDDWAVETPLMISGDFFVSPLVFEYLYNIRSEWNSAYQELTIKGNYFLSEEDKKSAEELEKKTGKKDLEEEKYDVKGKDFSLSSIHYKVELDYRDRSSASNILTLDEDLYLYGRINDWAITIGETAEVNVIDDSYSMEIPKIIAEYNKNNKLIIIGDTRVDYENTLGSKDFRGVYYRFPDSLVSKVFAYTSVSGEAEEGSQVTLYLNNIKYKEITVAEDNCYLFKNIQLSKYRLNSLKIVINDDNGRETIIKKNVAASPRLLEKGTQEFEAVAGVYTDENVDYWEGEMLGLKYNYAPADKLTYNLETVVNKQENYVYRKGILLSSDVGIAFGIGDNMVITFDWYLSEEENNYYSGGEFSTLYALDNGYIKAVSSYIPKNVAEAIQSVEGRNTGLIGVWDFTKNWSVSSGINYTESLKPESIYKGKKIDLSLTYNRGIYNYTSISGSYSEIHSLYEDPLTNTDLPGDNTKYGICHDSEIYREGFRFDTKMGINDNNIVLENNLKNNYQDINLENNIYKKISNLLLIKNEFKGSALRYNDKLQNINSYINTKFKVNISDNSSIELSREYNESEIDDSIEENYNLNINHFFNNYFLLNIGAGNSRTNRSVDYNKYSLNLNYNFNNNSNIVFNYNYLSPLEGDYDDHSSYEINYSKLFSSDKELNIALGKEYLSIFNNNHEYYCTISLSHALSFAGNRLLNQCYNSSGHKSMVTGIVYLDENNNKQFDDGEERLSDISMQLDNITAETDKDGIYKLEVMFPGIYVLNFDYNSLLADYTPVTEEKRVKLQKNDNLFLNFGLTYNGSISGFIFEDKNADGIFDENEKPIQWVGINLNGKRTTYTDKRGEFYFENVPLGEHEIEIVPESLPSAVTPQGGLVYKVKLRKDKIDVKDIVIPLIYKY